MTHAIKHNAVAILFTTLALAVAPTLSSCGTSQGAPQKPAGTNLKALKPAYIELFKNAFPGAALAARFKILDPITEGNVNNTYLHIFSANGTPLGFAREISTTTGCKSMCKPLDFILTLREDFSFNKILVWKEQPLTKKGHKEFDEDDYARLELLMIESPKVLDEIKAPMDLVVDGVSRATKPEYQNAVVATAAYSTLRIHVYKRQTQEFLAQNAKNPEVAAETDELPMPNAPNVGKPVAPHGPSAPPAPAPRPTVTERPAPHAPGAVQARDFTLPDIYGRPVSVSYAAGSPLRGNKVTILVFFGTWCPHCQDEMPVLERIHEAYRNDPRVQIIGIRTYRARETENVERFVRRFGILFPILSDTDRENPPQNQVANMYALTGVPSLFAIDKWGRIRMSPAQVQLGSLDRQLPPVINKLIQE